MMRHWRRVPAPWWSVLLAVALVTYWYGPILTHPADFTFAASADGVKNYFTPVWTVAHDHGWWFTGMNYPFGEHIVFTDDQPLVSTLLRALKPAGVDPVRFTIGALNLLMLASIPVAACSFCLLLREFGVRGVYASLAAVLLALASPQTGRMLGHFALAYGCFGPFLWWLVLRFTRAERRFGWGTAIGLAVAAFGFIHLYYLLFAGVFVGFYALAWALRRRHWRPALALVAVVFVVGLMVHGLIRATDPVADRPVKPWGRFDYVATAARLLLPYDDPAFVAWWGGPVDPDYSFIGWTGLLGVGLMAWRLVRRGPRRIVPRVRQSVLVSSMLAAVGVFLVAMGEPLQLLLRAIDEVWPALQQFRSLARLQWFAWNIFTVAAAVTVYVQARAWRRRGWEVRATALLALTLVLGWHDARIVHEINAEWIFRQAPRTATAWGPSYGATLRPAGADAREFQAVLGLPFFSIGSEKIGKMESSMQSVQEVLHAAVELGLPCASGMMSRTSLSQSLQVMQLIGDPLLPKEILARYPNRRPLLLVVVGDELEPRERGLIARADFLCRDGGVRLYRLPLDRLTPDYRPVQAEWAALSARLPRGKNWTAADPSALVVYRNFAEHSGPGAVGTQGAAPVGDGSLELFTGELAGGDRATPMEVSLWLRTIPAAKGAPFLHVTIEAVDGRKAAIQRESYSGEASDISDAWFCPRLKFILPAGRCRVRVWARGEFIAADELLIRPAALDVFTFSDDRHFHARNNVPFP